MSIEYNCENIPLGIFVTNHSRFETKRMKDDDTRYVYQLSCNIESHSHIRVLSSKHDSALQNSSVGDELL